MRVKRLETRRVTERLDQRIERMTNERRDTIIRRETIETRTAEGGGLSLSLLYVLLSFSSLYRTLSLYLAIIALFYASQPHPRVVGSHGESWGIKGNQTY